MPSKKQNGLLLNNDRVEAPQQQRAMRRIAGGSMGHTVVLQEQIGWRYNAILTGISFYVRDSVWSAVIKADFGNTPKVAFVNVGTFARCVEVVEERCRQGLLHWTLDKRPPKTRKYPIRPQSNQSSGRGGA